MRELGFGCRTKFRRHGAPAERRRELEDHAPIRVGSAAFGIAAALVAVPLVVVLPELGIPLLLLALRLIAVEFDWAAHSYAWVLWRWQQAVAWWRVGRRRRLLHLAQRDSATGV